jgi:hypothetical protein
MPENTDQFNRQRGVPHPLRFSKGASAFESSFATSAKRPNHPNRVIPNPLPFRRVRNLLFKLRSHSMAIT